MKNFLLFILTFFSFLILLLSCEKENEIPKTSEPFARASNMKFYFRSTDCIDLLNTVNNIRPIAFDFTIEIPAQATFEDSINYFYNNSFISYNSLLEKYYWQTPIYGKKGYIKHQFYVSISENDIDTLKAEFRYTTGADGGDGIYANIEKLSYNGIAIRHSENKSSEFVPENIFITKQNGKTTISFVE